jgi:uncharacterized protein
MLMNGRTGCAVASEVAIATTRRERRRGLLGRERLSPSEGLLLAPCMAIHTAFMHFPIDVVFVDGEGRAVQVVHQLAPWRVAGSLRARAVIELAAGIATAGDIRVGDHLYVGSQAASREAADRTC